MWIALLITIAHAEPDRVIERVGDSLREQSYVTVDGDGPVFGRWRRRSGDIVGTAFPDGAFERYTRRAAGKPTESHWYSAAGQRIGTLSYLDGQPATFTVTAPALAPVDVSSWTQTRAAGLEVLAPPPSTVQDDAVRWSLGGGTIELTSTPADADDDPSSLDFAQQLARSCGCQLLDRHTAWIDSVQGVRLLFDLTGETAELWAFRRDASVVALWASWANDAPTAHATLRAIASQAHWESP